MKYLENYSIERNTTEALIQIANELGEIKRILKGTGTPCGEERTSAIASPQAKSGKADWSFFCSECNVGISEKVKNYSETNFGLALCFDCQKKAREKMETAVGPRDVQK